jgi:hypothetical protein
MLYNNYIGFGLSAEERAAAVNGSPGPRFDIERMEFTNESKTGVKVTWDGIPETYESSYFLRWNYREEFTTFLKLLTRKRKRCEDDISSYEWNKRRKIWELEFGIY